jgi:hypothetical protein
MYLSELLVHTKQIVSLNQYIFVVLIDFYKLYCLRPIFNIYYIQNKNKKTKIKKCIQYDLDDVFTYITSPYF